MTTPCHIDTRVWNGDQARRDAHLETKRAALALGDVSTLFTPHRDYSTDAAKTAWQARTDRLLLQAGAPPCCARLGKRADRLRVLLYGNPHGNRYIAPETRAKIERLYDIVCRQLLTEWRTWRGNVIPRERALVPVA